MSCLSECCRCLGHGEHRITPKETIIGRDAFDVEPMKLIGEDERIRSSSLGVDD
jgi:hypothetical protein